MVELVAVLVVATHDPVPDQLREVRVQLGERAEVLDEVLRGLPGLIVDRLHHAMNICLAKYRTSFVTLISVSRALVQTSSQAIKHGGYEHGSDFSA